MKDSEHISYYYKPITSFISINQVSNDQKSSISSYMMSILTDRVSGGTSRAKGQLEIMVDRKIAGSDNKGVTESLNDSYDVDLTHIFKLCFD